MTLKDLKDSLQAPYKLENWQNILREVLGKPIFLTKDAYQPLFQETDFVEKAFQFGSYDLPKNRKIAIVDVKLKDEKTPRIADTKVKLRELAAKLVGLTNSEGHQFVGVLAFFHSTQQKNYRLSFIARAAEYNAEIDDFVNTETANKRFTYILGESESCTTAAKQLVSLIEKAQVQTIELNDIKEAFNVDKLNKEFFKGYKEHYEKFWKYINNQTDYRAKLVDNEQVILEKQEKPIRDFAKKLLGRIVFLYFLQKKGWMGVPADRSDWQGGDPNFIKNLFQNATDKSKFYSTNLIELFYNTLNQVRENDIFHLTATKVPYLNGGLFDNDSIETNHFDFPESYFQDLFEFFDQFNFTIDENSPDDANVGIDPEMLGHIFENLLEENKDKGAFYTPKAIVQYMCQESLIQYLETHLLSGENSSLSEAEGNISALIRHNDRGDAKGFVTKNARKIEELLDNVKICDPAIGSGAFPMGMLQEIFKAKMTLDLTLDPAETKRHIIQNSIYGVDLERGAVDIARLRFWLALVVDEDTPSPLPNLDYKIMQGNSLLESFEGIPLNNLQKNQTAITLIEGGQQLDIFGNVIAQQTRMEFLDTKKQDLDDLIDSFFDIDSQHKPAIKQQINDIVHEHLHYNVDLKLAEVESKIATLEDELSLININENDSKAKKEQKQKVLAIKQKAIEKLQNEQERLQNTLLTLDRIQETNDRPYFLWHLFFKDVFEQGGFDIVIGNPPYVGEKKHKDIFRPIQNSSLGERFYKGQMDLFYYFFHQAIDILNKNGKLCFITTNYFVTADSAINLRKDFKGRMSLSKLVNFNELKIFESALGQHNLITFLSKSAVDYCDVLVSTDKSHFSLNSISSFLTEKSRCAKYYKKHPDSIYEGHECYIRFEVNLDNSNVDNIFDKITKNAVLLEAICHVNAGIGVTVSKISNKYIEKFKDSNFQNGEGVFVVEPKIFDNLESEIIKNFVKNSDIDKYQYTKNEDKLIYLTKNHEINDYPKTKDHLTRFKQVLDDQIVEYEEDFPWYALNRPRTKDVFEDNDKIILPYRSLSNTFAYSDEAIYGSRDVLFIRKINESINMKFVLGVLNSKLIYFWLYNKGKRKGEVLELYQRPVSEIPIAVPTEIQKTQIETLVNQILSDKKEGKDTAVLESEIDRLVYALYELTEAEIAIVEGR